jgi:hypothetical protein
MSCCMCIEMCTVMMMGRNIVQCAVLVEEVVPVVDCWRWMQEVLVKVNGHANVLRQRNSADEYCCSTSGDCDPFSLVVVNGR